VAAISVRDLDEDVASQLKVRAARHGRSMEAEVRAILTDAVAAKEDEQPKGSRGNNIATRSVWSTMRWWPLGAKMHWLGSCRRSFRTLTSANDAWCSAQRPRPSDEAG